MASGVRVPMSRAPMCWSRVCPGMRVQALRPFSMPSRWQV